MPLTDDALFAAIADERRAFADELEALEPQEWDVPSLCDAWTVRGIAGHLLMPLVLPGPKFLLAMVASGFNFNKASVKLSNEVAEKDPAELVALLRQHAEHRFTPPGSGPAAPLTDVLVHGQDARRPLGHTRAFDPERVTAVLGHLAAAPRGFVPRKRVEGLRFVATDVDWSNGEGPVVEGPAEALMMALAGRRVALAELAGDGLATLDSRLA